MGTQSLETEGGTPPITPNTWIWFQRKLVPSLAFLVGQ